MRRAIKGFDGIRGLAALSIVVRHAGWLDLLGPAGLTVLTPLFLTGVPWFYVLSGFLITSLLIHEVRATNRVSLKDFYARRVLRLYPVLLTCLALIALFSVIGIRQVSFASWTYALLYMYNYVPRHLYDAWLGSFHTLATEEHFYLVFPPLFMLLRRRAGLLMGLLLAYVIVAPLAMVEVYTQAWTADYFVARWSIFAGEYIAAGCLAALAFERYPDVFRRFRWGFLLVGMALYLAQMFNESSWLTNGGITCLIVYVVLAQGSIGVRVLEVAPLRYLGRVSYGLYVWQSFYITTGPVKVGHWPLDSPYNLWLLAATVPLSWRFIEQPFLRLKDRFRPVVPDPSGPVAAAARGTPGVVA